MTTITSINGPVILDSGVFDGFSTGHFTSLTSTSVNVVVEGRSYAYQVHGHDFVDTDGDGRPDEGIVDSITVRDRDGHSLWQLSDIDTPITDLYGPPVLSYLLRGADDITGSAGNDYLRGGGANDIVRGGAGDDLFFPGESSTDPQHEHDRLYGGDGNDLFDYSRYNGRYDIAGGPGVDTLHATISGQVDFDANRAATLDGITLPDGSTIRTVESFTLRLGTGNDVFRGGLSGAIYQVGLGLGDDVAYLAGGQSVIWSGAHQALLIDDDGNESIVSYGFEDHDVIYADFSDAGQAVQTVNEDPNDPETSQNYGMIAFAGATPQTSESSVYGINFDEFHIVGSNFNDRLGGGFADDFLSGGMGDDIFSPAFGRDSIDGGADSDWLNFDIGAANAYGGWGITSGATIDLETTSAQVLPNYGGTHTPDSSLGTVVIASIENIQGTAFADEFFGTAGANQLLGMGGDDRLIGRGGNDILDGGAGADVMRGGAGDDIYHVDDAGDRAIENAGEGWDTVFSSLSYRLTANMENLTLTGSAVRASGNSLNNRIVGNDADNVIDGGLGADSMRGGGGNDIYYVNDSGDRIVENIGEGVDRVYSTVTYSATLNVDQVFLRGSGAINANGNNLDNVLVGNSAANVLNGRLGADDLRGGGGADSFYFDDGHFGGLTPSTCDRIMDFSHAEGDRIDLRDVDADSLSAEDQAFTFIGSADFHSVAGELRYQEINGNTYVYGDTDGDGAADFMIRLDGSHLLTSSDFLI